MSRRVLLATLFLLAISGFLLHFRIHPVYVTPPGGGARLFSFPNFLASSLPLLDALLVTALFASRRTAVYGYLLNGLIVIYGTVLMADFSIARLPPDATAIEMIVKSTLPDIGIAWADFLVGTALYDGYLKGIFS